MEEELISRRNDLVECLSNVDEEIGERYITSSCVHFFLFLSPSTVYTAAGGKGGMVTTDD